MDIYHVMEIGHVIKSVHIITGVSVGINYQGIYMVEVILTEIYMLEYFL